MPHLTKAERAHYEAGVELGRAMLRTDLVNQNAQAALSGETSSPCKEPDSRPRSHPPPTCRKDR